MLKSSEIENPAKVQRQQQAASSATPGALLPSRGKARSAALISAAQLRQSGPWAARQHYNAAKLLVRVVCAAAQLRAPARAPQSPPIAISGCKGGQSHAAKSDLVLQNCGSGIQIYRYIRLQSRAMIRTYLYDRSPNKPDAARPGFVAKPGSSTSANGRSRYPHRCTYQ